MKKQIQITTVLLTSLVTLKASLLLTTTIQSSNDHGATWADTEYSTIVSVDPSKPYQYFNGWCNINTNMGIPLTLQYVNLSVVTGTNLTDMTEGVLFVPGVLLTGTTNTIFRPTLSIKNQ